VSVYFKFDEATLSPEAEQKLADVGTVLAKFPALKIEVDGNADERGSEQYNLALGQLRADSAKKYLLQMGARPDQVATVSFGEEKPKALGHNEDAWKENRRDDVEPKK
jgi:peptidoglycan-associated lipoprotein